jgi:predicted regulator of Ras-like GTPase activity (Roadblock/LC7/MglB family)
MRSAFLSSVLTDLNGSSTDIEASALISTDGLLLAALLPNGMNQDRVGAMSAAVLSLADRTARELGRGSKLDQVLIRGDKGIVLMTYAGPNAVLTVLAKPTARLGLVFLDVKSAAETLARDLG